MSNPFLEPTDVHMYMLYPRRPAITTEGPTEAEAAMVARHWAYLQDLHTGGVLIFGGRTLAANEDCFANVVFRASSEEEARAVMEGDPGVQEGLFRARLFPYQVLLLGEWRPPGA